MSDSIEKEKDQQSINLVNTNFVKQEVANYKVLSEQPIRMRQQQKSNNISQKRELVKKIIAIAITTLVVGGATMEFVKLTKEKNENTDRFMDAYSSVLQQIKDEDREHGIQRAPQEQINSALNELQDQSNQGGVVR